MPDLETPRIGKYVVRYLLTLIAGSIALVLVGVYVFALPAGANIGVSVAAIYITAARFVADTGKAPTSRQRHLLSIWCLIANVALAAAILLGLAAFVTVPGAIPRALTGILDQYLAMVVIGSVVFVAIYYALHYYLFGLFARIEVNKAKDRQTD